MVSKFNVATVATLSVVLLASIVMISYVTETEALGQFLRGKLCNAKDYMLQAVKNKLISKSTIVHEYNQTMTIIKLRYQRAQQNGILLDLNEAEKENLYYKITVEELNHLKERIQSGSLWEQGASGVDVRAEAKALESSSCYDPDAMVENWNPDTADLDMDDETELWTELEDLENQARLEHEMGWSMTPEAKEALMMRTKDVLVDLLNNEVRQIAQAILTAYLSGGTLAPVLAALSGSLKFKIIEYLMNGILDVVSAAMGRRIEINPAPGAVPAAAAAAEVQPSSTPAVVEVKPSAIPALAA